MKMIMFTNITWSDYAITVLLLLFIWYLFLIFRFYSSHLKDFISGRHKINRLNKTNKIKHLEDSLFSDFKEPFDTLDDARELFYKLKDAIRESIQESRSKEEFKNYIKLILEEYPFVKISSLRIEINNLLVSECENHPQLHLTFAEVEGLWEETTL